MIIFLHIYDFYIHFAVSLMRNKSMVARSMVFHFQVQLRRSRQKDSFKPHLLEEKKQISVQDETF